MNILVTGGAGYIGSVLTRKLLEEGYTVKVADCLKWGGLSLLPFFSNPRFEFINTDLREEEGRKKALQEIDAVVHLAAIVGDPACKDEPELAEETNWQATKGLFDLANISIIKRFIFASTCSNYGKIANSNSYIDETGILNPVSLYARLKVKCEEYILQASRKLMAVVSLRIATAYGVSGRMRFDLTVNEFAKDLALGKELVVFGEQFWRPYCHVEDICQACILALQADKELIDGQVFNVGDTRENYQKKTLVEMIRKRIPVAKVRFIHKDEDPRDYRVNFDKIRKTLKFKITRTVEDGIDEVITLVRSGAILDCDAQTYKNS